MLNRIIRFSIQNKLIMGLFTAALALIGIYQLSRLPIDAVPDITDNQVQVITVSPSLGAPDVERLITFPVEQANSNISGLKEIRSFSRFGLSLVTIVFNDATDIYWARQQVAERLQKVIGQIPKGAGTPELGPVTTGLGEIYQYVLRTKPGFENKYDAMDLRTLQDWIVRRQLQGVEGVADVSSFGGKLKQYEIAVDADLLKASGVTMQEVFAAVSENNQNTGGAYIEKGPNLLYIRSEGLLKGVEDIENIRIKTNVAGLPVLLKDIGEVRYGHATRYGTMVYNDKAEVAGAVVMMLKGGNSSEVIENVKNRIENIQKTLPEGVVIEPFLDRTKMVTHAIDTVKTNLLEGALIVIFVLVLFLGNIRAGLLVASVIPLAMLFAISMMNLFGVSGNLMSLGALDFGLIIDGAVIIVEAVLHYLHHSKPKGDVMKLDNAEMDNMVEKTAGRMMNSAVFGQIIILVVYLPVFALSGIEGKMFKPMAQTVSFALLGAFILSLTYVPMMSSWFLSKKLNHKPNWSDRMMGKIEVIYQKTLEKILLRRKLVLGVSMGLMLLSGFVLSRMGGEFIPELEEGDFAIETRILTGSNLQSSIDVSKKSAKILMDSFPEVEKVVSKIGSGEIPTDPMPIEAQDLMVILKDKSEWTSAKTFDELAVKMGEKLSVIPGVSYGFQFPVQMRFNELMTGARQDVVCKIFGEDLDSLAAIAHELGKIASGVEGTADIYVEPVGGLPQIVIQYDRAGLARFGVSVEEVNSIVNTAFAGQAAGMVFEGEKRFDLVVRLKQNNRTSLEDVGNLLIATASGQQIPLRLLANVSVIEGPNQIQREDAKRRIIVGFNVRGRDVQTIVQELQKKAVSSLKMPVGYYVTYGGAFENLQAAKKRLGIAVPLSLLLIFILLYFTFGSVKDGLLIYTAIPLSAIGGIAGLFLRGMPFSISAGVGFIALFGVAVLNGIVLLSEFNRLKKEGMDDVKEIVMKGTKVRLRPVLMTAAVASLGFLPMALSHGAGAEVQRPLATVVIGGLISATFLTLFVLPILYIIFKKMKKIPVKAVATTSILLIFSLGAKAQQTISLSAALDSAYKNNLLLQGESKSILAANAIYNSPYSIEPTTIDAEYGQFNSIYKDNRFGISQSFSFPTVYKRQKEMMQIKNAMAYHQYDAKKNQLRRDVEIAYCGIVYLKEKEKLLLQTDSIFKIMLKTAEIRLNAGESNALEKEFLTIQELELRSQLLQLKEEIATSTQYFQKLINTKTLRVPEDKTLNILQLPDFNDTVSIDNHPETLLSYQQYLSVVQQYKIEKTKFLPNVNLGYSNTSIQGIGADDVRYSGGYRFQSFQFSLSLPVFVRSTVAKQKFYKYEAEKSELIFESQKQQLYLRRNAAVAKYRNASQTAGWYSQEGVKTAVSLLDNANKQVKNGEIDFLQFAAIYNQALKLFTNKTESEFLLQLSIIELQTINNP